ncbi:GNAT family N-acetyltransferase [Paracoccus cavernae]|uniref:GNAT family N-acetyltransferase n=1 Tax=Paracoccus cavernae TaxID=1571207 RepID=UPI0035F45E01
MKLRREIPADIREIRTLTDAAFADAPHSSGTEGAIIDALRAEQQLALSLVAVDAGRLVGHIAFSPVTISDGAAGWYGLGPMAVRPGDQGRGIGSALVTEGLRHLVRIGAHGCVVLGDPAFYGKFGFAPVPALRFDGAPAEYFMARSFVPSLPEGEVCYHKAFYGA